MVPEGPAVRSYLVMKPESEKALKLAIAQMYLEGVSTRKVQNITEKLCGYEISSTQVSRVTQELDVEFEQFRNRPIGEIYYLI